MPEWREKARGESREGGGGGKRDTIRGREAEGARGKRETGKVERNRRRGRFGGDFLALLAQHQAKGTPFSSYPWLGVATPSEILRGSPSPCFLVSFGRNFCVDFLHAFPHQRRQFCPDPNHDFQIASTLGLIYFETSSVRLQEYKMQFGGDVAPRWEYLL